MATWIVRNLQRSRRRPGFVRALAFGALALLMSGCVTIISPLSKDARFDAAEAPPAKGLILVGLRVLQEPTVPDRLFGGDVDLDPVYALYFSRLVDGKVAQPYPRVKICSDLRLNFGDTFNPCIPQVMRYRLLAVPPGRYALNNFTYSTKRSGSAMTSFVSRNRRPRMTVMLISGRGEPVSHPDRYFQVDAGEIVYIGDLSFDADVIPARMSIGRNDAAAQAALAGYPDVRGPIVFRPALGPSPALGLPTLGPG
jgi:hypothetical protein